MKKNNIVMLLFILLTAIFWHKVIFFKNYFFYDSIMKIFYPYMNFSSESIKNGEFPLWNPYIYSGVPFFANMQSAVLYPFSVLFYFLKFHIAYTITILIHTFLAGYFMFLLLKNMKLSNKASIAGSLIYMFNGFFISHSEFLSNVNVYIWLPLIFLFFKNYLIKNNFYFLLLSSICITMQFFGGHPQFVLYALLFVFFYSVYFSGKIKNFSPFLKLSAIFILFIFLSSVLFWPALELFFNSSRLEVRNISEILNYSLTIKNFFYFLFLPVWNLYIKEISGDPAIVSFYFGVSGLVLIIISILHARKSKFLFFLSFVFLSFLLLSLGENIYGYKYLVSGIKLLQLFRFPAQNIFICVFTGAVLGSFGYGSFEKKSYSYLLIIALFADLFIFGLNSNVFINKKLFFTETSTINYLKKDKSLFRVMMSPRTRLYQKRNAGTFFKAWIDYKDSIYSNMGMFYRIYDADGFEQMKLKHYDDILNLTWMDPDLKILDFLNIKYITSIYDIKNKKYLKIKDYETYIFLNLNYLPRFNWVINTKKFDSGEKILNYMKNNNFEPAKEVLLENKINTGIIKNEELTPGKNPTKDLKLIKISPQKIKLNLTTSIDGWLTIADSFYPGWLGYVNGKKVSIEKINYTFKGIEINKGENKVIVIYKPVLFTSGLLFTVITTLFVVFLLFNKIILKY